MGFSGIKYISNGKKWLKVGISGIFCGQATVGTLQKTTESKHCIFSVGICCAVNNFL